MNAELAIVPLPAPPSGSAAAGSSQAEPVQAEGGESFAQTLLAVRTATTQPAGAPVARAAGSPATAPVRTGQPDSRPAGYQPPAVTQGASAAATQGASAAVTQGAPTAVTQRAPTAVTQGTSAAVTQSAPAAVTQRAPAAVTQRAPAATAVAALAAADAAQIRAGGGKPGPNPAANGAARGVSTRKTAIGADAPAAAVPSNATVSSQQATAPAPPDDPPTLNAPATATAGGQTGAVINQAAASAISATAAGTTGPAAGPLKMATPSVAGTNPPKRQPASGQSDTSDPSAAVITVYAASATQSVQAAHPASSGAPTNTAPAASAEAIVTQRPPGQPAATPDAAVPNRDRVAEPVANATSSGSADHRQALQAVSAVTAQVAGQPSSEQAAASLVGDLAAGQAGPTASSSATGVTATHDQATASPMQQIAPALLSVTHTQTGTSQMTLRLNPPELGLVQVQIDRSANTASVTVIAERSDTLQMLQQDQPALQRALDQAGVPADGRTISFHVGELSGPAASGGNQGPGSNSGNPSGTADGNTMAHSQGGNSGGGAGYTAREQGGYASNRRSAASSSAADAQPADTVAPRWLRVGLDITA